MNNDHINTVNTRSVKKSCTLMLLNKTKEVVREKSRKSWQKAKLKNSPKKETVFLHRNALPGLMNNMF